MASEILIARHGETDWNLHGKWQGHTDTPLNERGVKQAEKLAAKMQDHKLTRIYSSDLQRARRTAQIVAEQKGIDDVIVDRRLRERYLGTFEGATTDEISSTLGVERRNLSILDIGTNPTIEIWDDFIHRLELVLNEIRESLVDETVLIVSHGGVMMALSTLLVPGYSGTKRFTNGELMHLWYNNGWSVTFTNGSD